MSGDFSTSTIGGQPVQLFNPWCRAGVASARCPATGTGSIETGGRFINAIIPRDHPAANPVGFNLAAQWPTETVTGDPLASNENTNPNAITTGTSRKSDRCPRRRRARCAMTILARVELPSSGAAVNEPPWDQSQGLPQ